MDLIICGITATLLARYLLHPDGNDVLIAAVVLFLVQYSLVKVYRLYIYPMYMSPLRSLPGPQDGLPLLGQAYNMFKSPPMELYISWMRKWPDAPLIRFMDVGNREVVLLNSVKTTKEVLQTNCYTFVKPAFLRRVLGEITGTGLLFAEGEAHQKQRRLLTGPFSHSVIKGLLPFFTAKAEELCSALSAHIAKRPGEPIEMTSFLSKTTLDAIGLAALGCEFNNLETPSDLSLAFEGVFGTERSTLFTVMSILSIYMPIRRLLPIKVNRDYLRANERIRELLRQRIKQRKAELSSPTVDKSDTPKDLLGVMIHERNGGQSAWSEDEMLNHLLNFMAAGHETTAGLLTLTLHLLAANPEVQDRLRKEILETVPDKAAMNYNSVQGLEYLSNVCREALRLYPPALASHREASKDVVIDGVRLPKGTVVHIVPAVIHYNPRIWGADADKFDPDRWTRQSKEASDPYASGSFLNGPRICIGKSFGLLEYKVYLIELLKSFTITAKTEEIEFQRGGPSLRLQGGLWLTLKPTE